MAKDLSVGRLLDFYGYFLSEKQRTLAAYYYNDDLSLAEIAENEGITRQAVCELIRRAEHQLRAWERECRYCESFTRLKSLAAAVRAGEADAEELTGLIEQI